MRAFVAVVTIFGTTVALAQARWTRVTEVQVRAADRLRTDVGGHVLVRFDTALGTPLVVRGDLGTLLTPTPDGAWRFLRRYRDLFGLASPQVELVGSGVVFTREGGVHLSFDRVVDGRAVPGYGLVVHANTAGQVHAVTGRYPRTPDTPSVWPSDPAVRPEDAYAVAASRLGIQGPLPNGPQSAAEVWVPVFGELRPAWSIHVTAMRRGAPRTGWSVTVDALDASIRDIQPDDLDVSGTGYDLEGQYVTFPVESIGGAFWLHDADTPPAGAQPIATRRVISYAEDGTFEHQSFSSTSSSFNDPSAVSAHVNLAKVYDYFWSKHGRKSYDGKGAKVWQVVHFGEQWNNASWSSKLKLIRHGDGDGIQYTDLARCLDTTGHEFTHAVIGESAKLVYSFQAGALNEAIADMFATAIDPPVGGPDDWHIAESCVAETTYPEGFLRHVLAPHVNGYPAHMLEFVVLPDDVDQGGVHTNSAIPSRAFALLVGKVGLEAAMKLVYLAIEGKYLAPSATFADWREALLSACGQVVGAPPDLCESAAASLDAVGIWAKVPAKCPPNAVPNEVTVCHCVNGFVFSESALACVPKKLSACGAIPDQGTCSNSVLSWCADGKPQKLDCAASGQKCGWDPLTVRFACLGKPCAGVTYVGICKGSMLEFCSNGALKTKDCGYGGLECGFDEKSNVNDCIIPPACAPKCAGKACGPDGCGGLCGDCGPLESCSTGKCVTKTPPSCGEVPAGGLCLGQVLRWCELGEIEEQDCAKSGYACGKIPGTDYLGCNPPQCTLDCSGKACGADGCGGTCGACPVDATCNAAHQCVASQDGCSDVPDKGKCVGSKLHSCADGTLEVLNCAAFGQICSWLPSLHTYWCLEKPCVPSCQGMVCGSDGCDGICGTCPDGKACNGGKCVQGTGASCCEEDKLVPGCGTDADCEACVCGDDDYCCTGTWDFMCVDVAEGLCNPVCGCGACVADCAGKDCGDDGCGGSCGACGAGAVCTTFGVCASTCVPSCAGRDCGDDGCGGTCGSCGPGFACVLGGCAGVAEATCGAVSYEGRCLGTTLQYCAGGHVVEGSCACCGFDPKAGNGQGWYDCLDASLCVACADECEPGTRGCSAFGTHGWLCGEGDGDGCADRLQVWCGDVGCDAATDACRPGHCGDTVSEGQCLGAALAQCSAASRATLTPCPGGCCLWNGQANACAEAATCQNGCQDACGGDDGGCSQSGTASWSCSDGNADGCLDRVFDYCAAGCSDGACLCQPDCEGRACGEDGCGGSCGTCPDGVWCASGVCQSGPPCNGLGEEGCCDGSIVTFCYFGTQESVDCAASGLTCGWGSAYYDCVATPAPDPTGTWPMACPAGCTSSCGDRQCGPDGCGGSCGTCPAGLGCGPEGTCTACGAITSFGCCDGETLTWCEEGEIVTADCSVDAACGWSDDAGLYDCATDGGADPSGAHPQACAACVPSCGGRTCGDDGCGGECGTCAEGSRCNDGECVSARAASDDSGCSAAPSAPPPASWLVVVCLLGLLRAAARSQFIIRRPAPLNNSRSPSVRGPLLEAPRRRAGRRGEGK